MISLDLKYYIFLSKKWERVLKMTTLWIFIFWWSTTLLHLCINTTATMFRIIVIYIYIFSCCNSAFIIMLTCLLHAVSVYLHKYRARWPVFTANRLLLCIIFLPIIYIKIMHRPQVKWMRNTCELMQNHQQTLETTLVHS